MAKQTKKAEEELYDLYFLRGTVCNKKKVYAGDIVKGVDFDQTMLLIGKSGATGNKACMVDSDEHKKHEKATGKTVKPKKSTKHEE